MDNANSMKSLLFIFNPHSGKAQIKTHLFDIADTFVKGGYLVTCYPTQCQGDCYRIITEISDRYDIVVASGGDGTLNESIRGLMDCSVRKPLGYIPAGSTNDFATTLGIPKDMPQAAEIVMNGAALEYDIGCFNGEYFCYIAAFGAFTSVSYETPQQKKNMFGHLAYVMEGIKQISSLESHVITVEHDGESFTDEFILGMVTNTISVGGFKQLTEMNVILDDGLFEVILIKTPRTPSELQNTLSCAMKQELDEQYFYSFKSSKVHFHSDEPISWTLDGENGGEHTEVEILNKMRAVSIIVDPDAYK